MGGKAKKSQRTKNNVRPSSSSRSAEMLSSAVTMEGGLVNLGGGKMLPALFPSLVAANLDQGLSAEYQMSFKKLNKKDPITRTKGLQELCELVTNGEVDDVVAALPMWAHVYKTLTADTDRKVREMTQLCHGRIAGACGRRLAPQLRALVPAWLQAQHDEHAPAHTHAHASLTSMFPDSKLPEVISFCKTEVMAHLLDNLVGNAEALINKRVESPEERELQWCRVVTGSLEALHFVVRRLPNQHDEWLWTELTPLLGNAAYWKFGTHTNNQVRASWFGTCGALIERFPSQFGDKFGVKTLRLMLNAGAERNAIVAAQLWTCLLLLMHHVPGWYTFLDKKELLIKRIIDLLENGGWGDARHLSNLLLPLLANLPAELKTKQFYETFFNAIFTGLTKKVIISSKSERQSWITSLDDCLRYLSIQDTDFAVEVATSVHRTWLEKVLAIEYDGSTRTNLIKTSATNMTALIKYWLKQSQEENKEKFDQLVRNFWQNVGATVLYQIDKNDTDSIDKLIEGHILLLQSLRTSFLQEAKKQHSIRFDDDQQANTANVPTPVQLDTAIVDRFKHNLDDLVHKICSHYFEISSKREISTPILTPLITLLNEFDSKGLFLAVARQFGLDSVYKLYEKVFRSWLLSSNMRCEPVVDIVFLTMKYMTEEEQGAMFDSFQQLSPLAVEWCVSRALRHPHVRGARARHWLRSATCAGLTRALAHRAATDARARALLLACIDDGPDGECLMSPDAVSEVVSTLTSTLADADSPTLEASAALTARLATTLADTAPLYDELVLTLFKLTVLVPQGDARLSPDTWHEARGAWQHGAGALGERRGPLLRSVARHVHDTIHTTEELDINRIEQATCLCPHLFNRCDTANAPDDVAELVSFTRLLFDMWTDVNTIPVESAALSHECVTSQLNCPYSDNECIQNVVTNPHCDLTKPDLIPYVTRLIFRSTYMKTLFLHRGTTDYGEDEMECWCDGLLKEKYLEEELCNIVYGFVVVNSLHEAYGFWQHYNILQQAKQTLQSQLESIIANSSIESKRKVSSTLSELAISRGYYWALAHRWYTVTAALDDVQDVDEHKMEDMLSGNGYFHCLQASTKWCSGELTEAAYNVAYVVMLRGWSVAHGASAGDKLARDVAACRRRCDLDVIVNAYYDRNDTMLYEMDITTAPWDVVVSNVGVLEFLAVAVRDRGWDLPSHHWDFITITLCSMLTSLDKSKDNWTTTKVSMLARSVLRLFAAVRQFVAHIRSESERRQPQPHVAELLNEWGDIFAPDTHYSLFCFLLHVLDTCGPSLHSNEIPVLSALLDACRDVSHASLPQAHRAGAMCVQRVVEHATAALSRVTAPQYKYLAYTLLLAMAKPLVLDDAERLSLWSEESTEGEEEKERPQFALDYFHDTFTRLQDIVETALSNVELAVETCEMAAASDSFALTLGWLLLADVLATLCELARGDLAHHYIRIYGERKYAEALIKSALRLLPAEVFAYALDNGDVGARPAHHDAAFRSVRHHRPEEAMCNSVVSVLSCACVRGAVCGAGGAGARGWWGAAPPRPARLLERVVAAYVAPPAIADQLALLQQRGSEVEDTEIHVLWSTNEVVCSYEVEERRLELRVFLAKAHPLVAPRLQARDAAGPGANTHWLALYLAYQNGTVLNALKMWTAAVSARVEAAPQCYICYCRLHPTAARLPKVACHQCKNKFHNLCLRKWFTTSNKSNCPLCRAAF